MSKNKILQRINRRQEGLIAYEGRGLWDNPKTVQTIEDQERDLYSLFDTIQVTSVEVGTSTYVNLGVITRLEDKQFLDSIKDMISSDIILEYVEEISEVIPQDVSTNIGISDAVVDAPVPAKETPKDVQNSDKPKKEKPKSTPKITTSYLALKYAWQMYYELEQEYRNKSVLKVCFDTAWIEAKAGNLEIKDTGKIGLIRETVSE